MNKSQAWIKYTTFSGITSISEKTWIEKDGYMSKGQFNDLINGMDIPLLANGDTIEIVEDE